jgi:hypothetical protein
MVYSTMNLVSIKWEGEIAIMMTSQLARVAAIYSAPIVDAAPDIAPCHPSPPQRCQGALIDH